METDLLNIANSYFMNGNFEGTVKEMNKALKNNAKDTNALFLLGCAQIELGLSEEAIKSFSKAIEEGRKDTLVFLKRGVAYFYSFQFNEAMEDFVSSQKTANEEQSSVAQGYINRIKESYN